MARSHGAYPPDTPLITSPLDRQAPCRPPRQPFMSAGPEVP